MRNDLKEDILEAASTKCSTHDALLCASLLSTDILTSPYRTPPCRIHQALISFHVDLLQAKDRTGPRRQQSLIIAQLLECEEEFKGLVREIWGAAEDRRRTFAWHASMAGEIL